MIENAKTVLLVDDDEDFRVQIGTRLRNDGYRVVEAPGEAAGEEAAEGGAFDVLVADLMMEHMDSGFVLCHHVKKRFPDKPVLLVTGVAGETGMDFDAATAEERRWVKADAMLAKPVRYEQLRAEIERLLA
jgi:CheY-like chemotaxis protein